MKTPVYISHLAREYARHKGRPESFKAAAIALLDIAIDDNDLSGLEFERLSKRIRRQIDKMNLEVLKK